MWSTWRSSLLLEHCCMSTAVPRCGKRKGTGCISYQLESWGDLGGKQWTEVRMRKLWTETAEAVWQLKGERWWWRLALPIFLAPQSLSLSLSSLSAWPWRISLVLRCCKTRKKDLPHSILPLASLLYSLCVCVPFGSRKQQNPPTTARHTSADLPFFRLSSLWTRLAHMHTYTHIQHTQFKERGPTTKEQGKWKRKRLLNVSAYECVKRGSERSAQC